jgi:hypothetical protein
MSHCSAAHIKSLRDAPAHGNERRREANVINAKQCTVAVATA